MSDHSGAMAIRLGHHELSEARWELDSARRLAQELLRDTVELTKQRDELAAVLMRLINSPVTGSGDYILSERDLADARADIAKARKP